MRRQDRRASNNLRKTIRLMKYLRDRQDAFSVPSIILTAMIGNQVSAWWTFWDGYKDLPTAFMRLVCSLDNYLQQHEKMPSVADPGLPQTTFNHRWDERRYAHFRDEDPQACRQSESRPHRERSGPKRGPLAKGLRP